ncbi:MAG: radical SAM protein, partial [Euryarchaeota archaeon]|nr:radical SAM protein [Euryarchaeota archaeon]
NFGKEIEFYLSNFPNISLTGTGCSLSCKHCNKKFLDRMIPATTPKRLVEICKQLDQKGVVGCLLSGGSRKDGTVPLDRFTNAIAQIKKETDLVLIAHTGPLNEKQVKAITKAGLNGALVDIIGAKETIKEIYGLNLDPNNFKKTLKAFEKAGIPNLSPHVIVGLHYGKLLGEFKALEMISEVEPTNIVIVAFIPTKETPFEKINPPMPEDVAKVIAQARKMFPTTPIALGCIRPGTNRSKMDELAIRAGVNKIAVPSSHAIKVVKSLNLKVKIYDTMLCCVCNEDEIKKDLTKGPKRWFSKV